jgi:Na+-transporting NADH:ubiquinone oxidoreductase subunit A
VEPIARTEGGKPRSVHRNTRGLDLPLAGEPALPTGPIETARAVGRIALLGPDSVGLKPSLLVQPGDTVQRGQPIFEDKKNPGVRYTAPSAGRVVELHRGERRALTSVVIEVDERSVGDQVAFSTYARRSVDALSADDVRALLLESGLWTALRTRPFSRVPAPDARPAGLFITAIDSRPHAPDPVQVLADRADDFRRGITALSKLTTGPVFLCQRVGAGLAAPDGVHVAEFAGPHPSGNAGWHIHRLLPVSLERRVWHINYQDVAAVGRLFASGDLDVGRVITLGGPGALRPRWLRTRIGASLEDLTQGELADGAQRVISGSVLDGRAVTGPGDAFLGRYHLQVSVVPEGGDREMFGFIMPGAEKFSVTRTVLGALRGNHRFAFSTTTNGSPRAMVPIGSYERVLPFDTLPTYLLRFLITREDLRAIELGALELDEDDLALATYVCPGKYEYGPLLRDALARIEKEN